MSTESASSTEVADSTGDLSGDLSVTALYTAQTWAWAGFHHADRFSSEQSEGVFKVTNAALAVMRLFRWRLPRLPQGLAQRHALIDQLTLQACPEVVVELASGLSSRALRACYPDGHQESGLITPSKHDVKLKRYIEVDLPHVIAHKRALYGEIDGEVEVGVDRIALDSLDLRELNAAHLSAWIADHSSPVVIAEGIMMYLSAEESERLLAEIASALQESSGYFIFDWVPTVEQPRPGLIGRALGWLMRLFTGGGSFTRDERTREEMLNMLSALGASARAIDTAQVASDLALPYPDAHTQQLVFCARWSERAEVE